MAEVDLKFIKPETLKRCTITKLDESQEPSYYAIDAITLPLLYLVRTLDFSIFFCIESTLIEFIKPGDDVQTYVPQLMEVTGSPGRESRILIRAVDTPKFLAALEIARNQVDMLVEKTVMGSKHVHSVFATSISYEGLQVVTKYNTQKTTGVGQVVGVRALDFELPDANGNMVSLKQLCAQDSILLVFYPRDFAPVCTKQLCNYRDSMGQFSDLGVKLVGISASSKSEHAQFQDEHQINFPLLSDAGHEIAKKFGCKSLLLLGNVSRATFIINRAQIILYRYVEPTTLTRRTSEQLVQVLKDLKKYKLI